MLRFLSLVFKLAVVSLAVGAMLSLVDLTAADLLAQIGLTPERLWEAIVASVNWAIPNILLGALIVVPVWFVIYLFRPPGS
ncbi:MAG: hypothetical protein KDI98_00495 [Hyphomicrobiaceae bacterium]|nr:hypothetical protein [Hyphomicrobiaceae bacterium]